MTFKCFKLSQLVRPCSGFSGEHCVSAFTAKETCAQLHCPGTNRVRSRTLFSLQLSFQRIKKSFVFFFGGGEVLLLFSCFLWHFSYDDNSGICQFFCTQETDTVGFNCKHIDIKTYKTHHTCWTGLFMGRGIKLPNYH